MRWLAERPQGATYRELALATWSIAKRLEDVTATDRAVTKTACHRLERRGYVHLVHSDPAGPEHGVVRVHLTRAGHDVLARATLHPRGGVQPTRGSTGGANSR